MIPRGYKPIFAVLLVSMALAFKADQWLERSEDVGDARIAAFAKAERKILFSGIGDEWIVLKPPQRHQRIKIVTHAVCDSSQIPPQGAEVRYSLDYILLGKGARELRRGRYHFRSEIKAFIADGEIFFGSFIAGDASLPASGRVLLVDTLSLDGDVEEIRVRKGPTLEPVRNVGLRIYYRQPFNDDGSPVLWDRLSREQKDLFSKSSLFSAEFLSEEEKTFLSAWKWSPLAPRGIEGKDYRKDLLYVNADSDVLEVEAAVFPEGIVTGPQRRAVLVVPEPGRLIRLEFVPRYEMEWKGEVRFWMNARAVRTGEVWSREGVLTPPRREWRGWVDGGFIEVECEQSGVVRCFEESDGGEREITPDIRFVRSFAVFPGAALEYEVLHEDGGGTPFRVDLRAFLTVPGRPDLQPGTTLKYELLGEDEAVLAGGELDLNSDISPHDSVSTGGERAFITEPSSHFFLLPAACARVRFEAADGHVLVVAFNRPLGHRKLTRIPEDYELENKLEVDERSWFFLRPVGNRRLMEDQRSQIVLAQVRPPADDPEDDEAREVEVLQPEEGWSLVQILARRDEDEPPLEGGSGQFHELRTGSWEQIEIASNALRDLVTPTLVYVNESDEPGSLMLAVDGEPGRTMSLQRGVGQISVGSLATGPHDLQVICDPRVRVFINHLAGSWEVALDRKSFHEGEDGTLTYWVVKEHEAREDLVGRTFFHGRPRDAVSMCLTVEGPLLRGVEPATEWTFDQRLYRFTPGKTEECYLVGHRRGTLTRGGLFVVPLKSDCPPGVYRVRIQFEQGARAFARLSRLRYGAEPGGGTIYREEFAPTEDHDAAD